MQVLIFNEYGLKMPIQAPKMEVSGITLVNGEQPYRDPQRAPACIETPHITYRSLRSVQPFLHSPPYYPSPKSYALQWAIHSPKSSASRAAPHLIYGTLHGQTQLSIPNGISISSAVFAPLKPAGPYTLQCAAPFPLRIVPSPGRMWTPRNIWFLGPT